MHRVAATRRGPSPWRRPAGGPELWPPPRNTPLVALAGVQLALILTWSIWLAWLASFAYGDWSSLARFDGDEPACTDPSPFPLARFLIQAGAWATVVVLGAVSVVIARRRRREVAIVVLAASAVAALAAIRLAEIPLPLW